MTQAGRPHQVIAQRMKKLRRQREWSAQRLAEAMTNVGVRWDRSIVANLENGRRATVSVEELLALAYVLDVAPVHLVVPLDDGQFHVTPEWATNADRAREWFRGQHPLPSTDPRIFFSEVPLDEWQPPQMTTEDVERRGAAIEALRKRGHGPGGDRGDR